ncbi:MAG: chitobiase/beta-hexosaminidase C-terminal domain-containing protein [Bacteroidales bacterium]|nr:chitobiase/beta-hexosaminidase C-terminal domain-containing protein [Bacteroidales bacterium]
MKRMSLNNATGKAGRSLRRCAAALALLTAMAMPAEAQVKVHGSVFGAGRGLESNKETALVSGDSKVEMSAGRVYQNVYGGGEMASVGSGVNEVSSDSSGKATVVISGGTVGPDKLAMPQFYGHVFGGGKGVVRDTTLAEYADIPQLNNVRRTEVVVEGGLVKGSVYGGSENGHVLQNTHVEIKGGQIGCVAGEDGQGGDDIYSDEDFEKESLAECPHWPFAAPYSPYDKFALYVKDGDDYVEYDSEQTYDGEVVFYYKMDDGNYESTENGRPQGSDGHTFYGNVFGGGSGYSPYAPKEWLRTAGRVGGKTKVVVSGGHILTSVYGGCEVTDVLGDCEISITDGTVGVPRTLEQIVAHPVTCSVFGAGKGDQRIFFNQWTNNQNSTVSLTGNARIFGSVFGGGEDGHVLNKATVNVGTLNAEGEKVTIGTLGYSYLDGNVFGGGRGFSGDALTAGSVGGNTEVNINNGSVLGSVYGGGRLASVGIRFTQPGDEEDGYGVQQDGTDHGYIVVNVKGGTIGNTAEFVYRPDESAKAKIPYTEFAADGTLAHTRGGNVFGGSMGRFTLIDENIVNPLWSRLALAKNTEVNITGGVVRGNVYGGGELGSVADNSADEEKAGNSKVTVGGTAEVGTEVKSGGTTMYCYGSVYGGGYGSSELAANLYVVGTDAKSTPIDIAGRVEGRADVVIEGDALVRRNVYGGGEVASLGVTSLGNYNDGVTYKMTTGSHGTYNMEYDVETGTYVLEDKSSDTYEVRADRTGVTGGEASVTLKDNAHVGRRLTVAMVKAFSEDQLNALETEGMVFGAGKGMVGKEYARYTYVGSTEVKVLGNASLDGSVFGGGENGHVVGDTKVTIGSGDDYPVVGRNIVPADYFSEYFATGTARELYFGNVYGGGRGIETNGEDEYSLTAGRVEGNTYVTLLSGRVTHNVYGGGSLASVGSASNTSIGSATVTIGSSEFAPTDRKIFIGLDTLTADNMASHFGEDDFDAVRTAYFKPLVDVDFGYSTYHANVPDVSQVSVSGRDDETVDDRYVSYYFRRFAGRNEGRVFGSGRGQAGSPLSQFTEMSFTNNSVVNIENGAVVRGSVFGGGENGHVRQNTTVNMRGGFIGTPLWKPAELPYAKDGAICSKDTPGAEQMSDADYYRIDSTYNHWENTSGVGPTVYYGNLYGGGRGVSRVTDKFDRDYSAGEDSVIIGGFHIPYEVDHKAGDEKVVNSATAGRVYGNATVNMLGGRVYHHIYGGGSLASVGDTVHIIALKDDDEAVKAALPSFAGDIKEGDIFEILGYKVGNGKSGEVYDHNGAPISAAAMPEGEYDRVKEFLDGRHHWLTAARDMGQQLQDTNWTYEDTRDYRIGDALFGTGIVTINVKGGVVGTDGINEGRVYGSGRGIAGSSTSQFTHMAFCHNTVVNIGKDDVAGTEADIRGCVFGGGANGHVTENAIVNMTAGTVGAKLSFEERRIDGTGAPLHRIYRGNIYGGGRGVDPISNSHHISQTAGRVYGNTKVHVSGGTVRHSVYGGGSLASVGTYEFYNAGTQENPDLKHLYHRNTGVATVIIDGDAVIGPKRSDLEVENSLSDEEQASFDAYMVAHGNSGFADLPIEERRQVYYDSCFKYLGANEGMVYGSGRGVAAFGDGELNVDYSEAAFTRRTVVVLQGNANVVGSLFGGGENGHVKGNTNVYIDGGIVGGVPLHGCTSADHGAFSGSYTIPEGLYKDIVVHLHHDADNVSLDESELREDSHGVGRSIMRGNVYGGGRGVDHDVSGGIDKEFSASAGRVYGKVSLNISGGKIYRNVFGGGSVASVGFYDFYDAADVAAGLGDEGQPKVMRRQYNIEPQKTFQPTDYEYLPELKMLVVRKDVLPDIDAQSVVDKYDDIVDDIYYYTTGLIMTHITGGQIGITGHNEGQVYGAGRGMAGANTSQITHLAYCNETDVQIGGDADIRGSVFGGGANGHVLTDTKVTVSGGTIGAKLTIAERQTDGGMGEHIYRGNVYGGGRGVDPYDNAGHLSQTAGRVYGNTEVVVEGGSIRHAVYGGGSLASVGTYDLVNYGKGTVDNPGFGWTDDDEYWAHVFRYRPHIGESEGRPTGKATVTVRGGRVGPQAEDLESFTDDDAVLLVYTDGEGDHRYTSADDFYAKAASSGHGITNLPEYVNASYLCLGENEGSVYGSGRGVAYTHDENAEYAEMAFVKESEVNIEDGAFIVGSVFGGGENGHVRFDSHVNIKGGTIGGIPMHASGTPYATGTSSFEPYSGFAAEEVVPFGSTGGSHTLKYDAAASLDQDELRENWTGTGRTIYRGNVYGGGRGVDHGGQQTDRDFYSSSAGRVYGNAFVDITGGHIYHHVYGGGSLASVGNYEYYADGENIGFPKQLRPDEWAYEYLGLNPATAEKKEYASNGNIQIVMTAGQLGFTGINEGHIYGAGRGIAGSHTSSVVHLAYCNTTSVYVGCRPDSDGGTTLADGTVVRLVSDSVADIRGSVFGGGANGHVLADTRVVVGGGTIGAPLSTTSEATYPYRDDESGALVALAEGEASSSAEGVDARTVYRGNVYGGGRGVNPIGNTGVMSYTAGHVYGNTNVFIVGGEVRHNVYGGGSLASVGTRLYKAADGAEPAAFSPQLRPTAEVPYTDDDYFDVEGVYADNNTGRATVVVSGGKVGATGYNEGRVFGAGRGVAGDEFDSRTYLRETSVTVEGTAAIHGSVFGGGENGHVQENATVTILGGTVGTALPASPTADVLARMAYVGNVYGAGRGVDRVGEHIPYHAGYVRGNTEVNILGGTVYHNVYGGGSMAMVGDYGLDGSSDDWRGWDDYVAGREDQAFEEHGGLATVNIKSDVGVADYVTAHSYGGNVYGSSRGRANTFSPSHTFEDNPLDDYSDMAYVVRTEVNIDAEGHTVHGSVYGGGENGHVDFGGTTVNILNGTVRGNVFGGGRGSASSPSAGIVDGNTQVNIGTEEQTAGNTVVINGMVFAGNDANSSPLGTMRVDVWHTAHTAENAYPATEIEAMGETPTADQLRTLNSPERFALKAVYGGGNQASVLTGDAQTDAGDYYDATFDSPATPASSQYKYTSQRVRRSDYMSSYAHSEAWPVAPVRKSVVYVHGCQENTIEYVYGGGRAANTKENEVIIEGGHISQAYAGGNGSSVEVPGNPGANVENIFVGDGTEGMGNATVTVKGGLVHQTFGGSNSKGIVRGISTVGFDKSEECPLFVEEVYGGGNEAEGEGEIIVTVPCGTTGLTDVYGCSRQAPFRGNVVLNILGGVMDRAFGGAMNADIDGNVEVNVYGGTIGQLFGGNNVGGNISGQITVNIDYTDENTCPDGKRLDYVYGGGNEAAYTPTYSSLLSPRVNVINGYQQPGGDWSTVDVAVFGGGLGGGAVVTANPYVVVGADREHSMDGTALDSPVADLPVRVGNASRKGAGELEGNVFGGGNRAEVHGNTAVVVRGAKTKVYNNVYGGGNSARVDGNTDVQVGSFGLAVQPTVTLDADGKVVLASLSDGAKLFYTTDGSVPDNSSTPYTAPFDAADGTVVRAVAYHEQSRFYSPVAEAGRAAAPVAASGDDGKVAVSSLTPGAQIRYTTDGSEPTEASALYSEPVSLPAGATLRAVAVRAGFEKSAVTAYTAE